MIAFRLLQLADSAFPTGGFAHSGGLEAAIAIARSGSAGPRSAAEGERGVSVGRVDVEAFAAGAIAQLAHGALPFVHAVHADLARWDELDAFASATLWSHVAARASRAQGRALVDVAARGFEIDALARARARIASGALAGHLAPAFGAVARAIGIDDRDDVLAAFLHLGVRGVLSAAVRLGAIGPTEGVAIHARLAAVMADAVACGAAIAADDVAQVAPLVELVQGAQDRLYTRLFQT